MEKFYRRLTKFHIVTVCMLFLMEAAIAQAPFTVTGIATNTSCYGMTNGAINVTVTGAGGGQSTGNFCSPSYTNPSCQCGTYNDMINNFSTTGGSTNISNLNSGCNGPFPSNYTFFSSQTVTVDPGQTFGISVQCAPTGTGCGDFSQGFRIWIDYNHDGDFLDANESVWNSGTSGPQMFTGNITVPASTPCGPYRMRVRCRYAGVPDDPCALYGYGETEDYNVQVCSPASFQWSNGATTEDINNLAAGQYTVTVTAGTNSSVVTFNVNQPSQVTTHITAANNDTLLCPGETTVLTASGQPTWSYVWSNGATGSTVTAGQPAVYTVTVSNSNGCSATDQITVLTALASNPPVITPSDTAVVCEGGSVTLTVTPSGNTTWQPNGQTTPTISVSQSGNFYVTFTDASGCTGQTEPVTVTVLPPPVATITASGPTVVCEGESVVLSSNYASGNLWSDGSTGASIAVTAAGTYGLTVSVAACTDDAQTVDVTVNPLPTPQITPNGPLTFCEGGSVNLASNYTTGNYWSSFSTMQQITVDYTSSYTLTVTDANGCSASTGPVNVTVNPIPAPPVISASGPTSICNGSSVTLASSYASGNQWSNSTGAASITVSTGGAYTVTVTDANGCTASSAATTVTVNPVPTASFTVPSSVCIADNATVTYTGTGSAGANYAWSFDSATVVSGSGQGPYTLSFGTAGPYDISLQVTEPATGCVSTLVSNTVQVNTSPTADFTASASGVCEGDSLVIAYTGSAPASSTYAWNFGNGVVLSGNGQGPYSVRFPIAGVDSVSLVVTQGSCESQPFIVPVAVHALPDPTFATDHSVGCDSITVQFFPTSSGATYAWNFGDGSYDVVASPVHSYPPGIYTVSLAVLDTNGCANAFADTALVQVYETPVAAFATTPALHDTLNMDEAVITFDNQSQHAAAFDWDFGDGATGFDYSPTHAYTTSGQYTVQLVAVNQLGCADTAASETFFVLPGADTFVPNTFTPNGDGKNDFFKVYSYRYKEAFLTVYDRIGQKMFETKDIEKGWDGNMKGHPCNSGVYVYYAKIVYLNGEVKEFFGDVTLFR